MSRQPTANAGKILGRYRIERELGRGGMGVVYVAQDVNTGRLVALKTTSVAGLGGGQATRTQRRQRFVREVQALTQVSHDNVVHVIDAGESDDPDLGWLLFYAMQYVEGETLAQLVQRRGPLDAGAAAAVCMQVGAGLGAAHASGIVHRDVKPANIFISLDSRALIGDFGICKIEGQTQITRRDQLVGTPNYLAPEQILGEPVSPATDVFALGALFYVITMNRPLRSHVDAASLLRSASGDEPKERLLAEAAIPAALRKIFSRCLEREPAARWAHGQALADALAEHATRIPSLRDETNADTTNDSSSSSDRSSPFATLPSAPSGDVLEVPKQPFADPDDVEAAARALLGEVEKRESAQRKQDERSLPVAKTESTVMFNIRAMEEEHESQSNKGLPVARTISTVVFQGTFAGSAGEAALPTLAVGKGAESPPKPPSNQQPNQLEETGMGFLDDPTPVGGDTRDDVVVPQPPVKRFTVDDVIRKSRQHLRAMPQLSRPAWIGISGFGGVVLGLLFAVALAPPSYSTEGMAPKAPAAETTTSKSGPPLACTAEVDPQRLSKGGSAKAKSLVAQARALEKKGAALSERRRALEEALRNNPLDAEAYYELGNVHLQDKKAADARAAYRCACIVGRSSPACKVVEAENLGGT